MTPHKELIKIYKIPITQIQTGSSVIEVENEGSVILPLSRNGRKVDITFNKVHAPN